MITSGLSFNTTANPCRRTCITAAAIVNKLAALSRESDRAAAAVVMDLKQRGLLDSTIVVWGGEFGRTPMNEARNGSMWLTGGGIKPSGSRTARARLFRNGWCDSLLNRMQFLLSGAL